MSLIWQDRVGRGSSGSVKWADITDKPSIPEKTNDLINDSGFQTAEQVDAAIEDHLKRFDKLDYRVADGAPTAETVIINGVEEETVEGVRYMVKHTTDDKYEEYILLSGVVYDIGSTSSINLDGYATEAWVETKLESVEFVRDLMENTDILDLERKVNQAISNASNEVQTAKNQFVADVGVLQRSTRAELEQLKSDTADGLGAFKTQMQDDITAFKENETETFSAWFADKRNLLNDDAAGEIMNRIDDNYLVDFKRHHSLFDSETVITPEDNGKRIVQATHDAVITTVVTEANGVKTITEEVVPSFGLYKYVKTTVITQEGDVKTIRESVAESAKEGGTG